MGLLSGLAAYDLGYLPGTALIERTRGACTRCSRLERCRGHLYNWYDTRTLQPVEPRYVSSVDSGNLWGALTVLAVGLDELRDRPVVPPRFLEGLHDTLEVIAALRSAALFAAFDDPFDACLAATAPPMRRAVSPQCPACPRSALPNSRAGGYAGDHRSRGPSGLAAMDRDLPAAVGRSSPGTVAVGVLAPHAAAQPPRTARRSWGRACEKLRAARSTGWMPTARSARCRKPPGKSRIASPGCWQRSPRTTIATAMAGRACFVRPRCRSPGGRTSGAGGARATGSRSPSWRGFAGNFCKMDFRFLFHPQRKLLSIGFQVSANRRDNSYYDLLASEARLTSFLAVSHGQLPPDHWFALGRMMTLADGKPVLLSWSGSMFEYLMPALLMPSYPGTLLGRQLQRRRAAADPLRPAARRALGHFRKLLQSDRRAAGLPVSRPRRARFGIEAGIGREPGRGPVRLGAGDDGCAAGGLAQPGVAGAARLSQSAWFL